MFHSLRKKRWKRGVLISCSRLRGSTGRKKKGRVTTAPALQKRGKKKKGKRAPSILLPPKKRGGNPARKRGGKKDSHMAHRS